MAEMYASRGHEGDLNEARILYAQLIEMYDDMRMQFHLERASERLDSL